MAWFALARVLFVVAVAYDEKLPVTLVKKVVKTRLAEVEAKAKANGKP